MTIDYIVNKNGREIRAFPDGVLDLENTSEYFKRLEDDSTILPGAIEVVCFTKVKEFNIPYTESQQITQKYQGPKTHRKIKATIFVCETELAYGMGRMLQTLHNITNPTHRVLLVKTESELDVVLKNLDQ